MNFLAGTIATVTVTVGSIAGCQPPPSDQFQPGIPVVEQAPIPVYGGGATANTPATRTTCKVQTREGTTISNLEAGCQLNVYMKLDTVDGRTPDQRCLDMGGIPRGLKPLINCIDVDY